MSSDEIETFVLNADGSVMRTVTSAVTTLEPGDIVTVEVNEVVAEWEIASVDWAARTVDLMYVRQREGQWPSFASMRHVPLSAIRFVRKGQRPDLLIPLGNVTIRPMSEEEAAEFQALPEFGDGWSRADE